MDGIGNGSLNGRKVNQETKMFVFFVLTCISEIEGFHLSIYDRVLAKTLLS